MRPHRLVLSALALAIALSAFAHAGHKHQFLGTVKTLHENHLTVTTTEGKDVTFTVTSATRLVKGTSSATAADLREGVRVSVAVEDDGTTARTIKIAA